MKKSNFLQPEIRVVKFEQTDVIYTSGSVESEIFPLGDAATIEKGSTDVWGDDLGW